MKKNVVGLIAEYNPFHNGHSYHLKEIDKIFNNNLIKIAVISGDFVQRGEPSILNKISKTHIALEAGIDIVVELPAFCSTQSAEIFSRTAISALEKFSCDALVFGSESNDLKTLYDLKTKFLSKEFNDNLKSLLKKGISYPNAFALAGDSPEIKPNDILAIEYLKALDFFNSKMKPLAIKRQNVEYYGEVKNEFASASFIRKELHNKKNSLSELKTFLHPMAFNFLEQKASFVKLSDFFDIIKFQIIQNFRSLSDIQDMEVGLENRIYKCALEAKNFEELFSGILTKRITISRLQRILLHILLNIDKNLTNRLKTGLSFVKVLGFSSEGQKYLNELKHKQELENKKIIVSTRNLKSFLPKEDLFLYDFNEYCSNIYKIKNNYRSFNFPIIKRS